VLAVAACLVAPRLSTVKHCLTADQVHQLAAHTQGFVGADLAALINEAALAALRRHVAALQQHEQQQPRQQQQQHGAQQGLQDHPKQQRALLGPGRPQDPVDGVGLCVCWQDFEAARLLVGPSALREVAVEAPQVSKACTTTVDVAAAMLQALQWMHWRCGCTRC